MPRSRPAWQTTVDSLRDQASRLPQGSAARAAESALAVLVAAEKVDPTLLDWDREARKADLLAELFRQLRPLARQAAEELERRAGTLPDGRVTAKNSPEDLEMLTRRAVAIAKEIAAAADPDWNTPSAIRRRSEQRLPCATELHEIADELRRAVQPALELEYPAEEAVRLAALADQIATPPPNPTTIQEPS